MVLLSSHRKINHQMIWE